LSSVADIVSGVVQGSCLGPVLFPLYVKVQFSILTNFPVINHDSQNLVSREWEHGRACGYRTSEPSNWAVSARCYVLRKCTKVLFCISINI